MFDEKFNQEYEKTLPKISKFYSNISTNKELFKAYKRVLDTDLTQQQTHIINEAIKGFQLSGIDLDADSQEEFKKIQERLTVLSNTFSKIHSSRPMSGKNQSLRLICQVIQKINCQKLEKKMVL